MDFALDNRIVLTLDAGGTNFVFSALQYGKEIVTPVSKPSNGHHLDLCLKTMIEGFTRINDAIGSKANAISFAFPGPADYPNGIIGDLPNMPAFRGGIALGAFLEQEFNLPVFINNDGNLFAYGEAMAGILPRINNELQFAGNPKQYKNLIGLTLGTGFGAGIVLNNQLLMGDNSNAAEVWLLSNPIKPLHNIEELVSARAIVNFYKFQAGDNDGKLTPFDVYKIAKAKIPGDKNAALQSFIHFGKGLADAVANLITLIDGIVVIGGGIAAAQELYMPALMQEIKTPFRDNTPRLIHQVYNYSNKQDRESFLHQNTRQLNIPHSNEQINYNSEIKTTIAHSILGASRAIQLGAYLFALNNINEK